MYNTKNFGAFIAAKRTAARMTQSDLAEILNLTRQAVSRYETGKCFPEISVVIKLAEIFRVTIDELIKSGVPP